MPMPERMYERAPATFTPRSKSQSLRSRTRSMWVLGRKPLLSKKLLPVSKPLGRIEDAGGFHRLTSMFPSLPAPTGTSASGGRGT